MLTREVLCLIGFACKKAACFLSKLLICIVCDSFAVVHQLLEMELWYYSVLFFFLGGNLIISQLSHGKLIEPSKSRCTIEKSVGYGYKSSQHVGELVGEDFCFENYVGKHTLCETFVF